MVRHHLLGSAALCAAMALSGQSAAWAQSAEEDESDEIVVTASRRSQSLIDVPYNVSAYGRAELEDARIDDLTDLAQIAPGIASVDSGTANRTNRSAISLRGLSANTSEVPILPDGSVPTVSTYIGDTPVNFPMRVFDLDRVEVLRGPQGTLYGSGSLAGTIRLIPSAPSFGGWSGSIEGRAAAVSESEEYDSGLRFVLNAPLIDDTLAFRIAGGYESLAGFIDKRGLPERDSRGVPVPAIGGDLTSGFVLLPTQEDANDARSTFVRTSLRFAPTVRFDATLSYAYQRDEADNAQAHNPSFAGGAFDLSAVNYPGAAFANTAGVPGGAYPNGATVFPSGGEYDDFLLINEPYEREVEIVALEGSYDVGFATISSSTSYSENVSASVNDGTGSFEVTRTAGGSNLASFYGFYPRLLAEEHLSSTDRVFTQELRLVSNDDGALSYVLGAYYSNQTSSYSDVEMMAGVGEFFALSSPEFDNTFNAMRRFEFTDLAIFGELTYQIMPRWQVTAGVRAFDQSFDLDFFQSLPLCGAPCAGDGVAPDGSTTISGVGSEFSDQIFRLNTSFDLTDDVLVYATYSEGFRRGGSNGIAVDGNYASLPEFLTFAPDSANNYEMGIKGRMGAHRFTFAAFYIDWESFQFEDLTPSSLRYVVNGSDAISRGLEIELIGDLSDEWSYSLGYTYTDAYVATAFVIDDLPPFSGGVGPTVVSAQAAEGTPLPGISEHTLTASLRYRGDISGGPLSLVGGLDASYRSDFSTDLDAASIDYSEMDGFTMANGSLGIESDAGWSVVGFVDNIFNELGETGGAVNPAARGARSRYVYVARPRTIGIQLRHEF